MTTTRPTEHADSQDILAQLSTEPANVVTQTEGAAPDNDVEEESNLVKFGVVNIVRPGELSPEQTQTLATLKANFDRYACKFPEIQWPEVEAKLNKEPAKLITLQKLIDRGGEPTVTAKIGNNFRFDEISKESPEGKRNVNWKQAFDYAKNLGEGVQLMNKDVYSSFKDKVPTLDETTWSWLNDDPEKVERTGRAFNGRYGFADRDGAHSSGSYDGLRCSLEV